MTFSLAIRISLHGIAFNRDGDFTLANGDGTLILGAGGVTASALQRTVTGAAVTAP